MEQRSGRWFGSDRIVERLFSLGIEHLALNPGASIRGLHDSLVNQVGRSPGLVLALHEEIAVALAHGFAKASGRPMAVALHDTVGLLHASMAIFNAWVDRVPMLLLVGTGPLDGAQRRPWIDWIHTVGEQGAMVREFTVWNDQPTSLDAALSSLDRGLMAAMTGPCGPALVAIDVAIQEVDASAGAPPRDRVLMPATIARIGPDPQLVEVLVKDMRSASRPLFVTDRPLTRSASALLVQLAERTGAALLELGGGASFPVGHPHDVSEAAGVAFQTADHVTFIEVRDPAWGLGQVNLETRRLEGRADVRASASIGLVALTNRSWMITESAGPSRVELIADPDLALDALIQAWGSTRRALDPAFAALAARSDPPLPSAVVDDRGIHRGHVGRALAGALAGRDWTVANGLLGGWARRTLRYERSDQFLGRSGGEGLGYGPGATLGAALASKGTGRVIVDLQGDGDLLYTPQALWTAAHHGLGLIMVVDANRSYHKDELHQVAVARQRGRPIDRVGRGILIENPTIDIAGLARSLGVAAEGPIVDPADLRPAFDRAVSRAAGGEPALVEVRTSPA